MAGRTYKPQDNHKAGTKRQFDRETLVPLICARLRLGAEPLNCILASFDPPIHPDTVRQWRKNDPAIARDIDIAFETGSDRMAMDWLGTAEGKKPGEGGRSTGNVKRDKMICNALDRLLTKWDLRYRPTVALANDPQHPITNATKAIDMTEEQLLNVAAQGLKGVAEAGQKAAGTEPTDG